MSDNEGAVAVAVVVDNGEPEGSGCNPHYSGPLKVTVFIALFIEVFAEWESLRSPLLL